jgi:hypothetical protein
VSRDRAIEWAAQTLTQGEILDAFCIYCEGIDDIEVLEHEALFLRLSWRGRETSTVEIADTLPAAGDPTLVLAEITDALAERFLDDEELRGRVAVYDLAQLAKINAVRSSSFVYFEWFLRDLYGVKILAANAFTQGLVARGIISLGMG